MAQDSSTEKGANFKCKHCGGYHGGLRSVTVCPDCYDKGKR
jgi:rubrerythrin